MRREERNLLDIVKGVGALEASLGGRSFAESVADHGLRDAVLMRPIVIGEAAAQLPDLIRRRYSDVSRM